MTATLWVVATPIGNLDDFSARAVKVLESVSKVYAEDTRRFGKLAARYNITTDARSCFDANESARVEEILTLLRNGEDVALVSEAGTPCISDPGFRVVSACRNEGLTVSCVPGASAAIAALSVSGFETDRFCFEGFLPQKSGRRGRALETALASTAATIFYESPYRILKTLKQLTELDAERDVFLAREMTKMHEEFLKGTGQELFDELNKRGSVKGEFVLILRGAGKGSSKKDEDPEHDESAN